MRFVFAIFKPHRGVLIMRIPHDSAERPCTKCGKSYPATMEFFIKSSQTKDKLSSWCRLCHRAWNNQKQAANRSAARKRARRYRERHLQRNRERVQRWQEENREFYRTIAKEWSRKHPDQTKARTTVRVAL